MYVCLFVCVCVCVCRGGENLISGSKGRVETNLSSRTAARKRNLKWQKFNNFITLSLCFGDHPRQKGKTSLLFQFCTSFKSLIFYLFHTHTHTHTRARAHRQTHVCAHTHARTHTHAHIHKHKTFHTYRQPLKDQI